MSDTALRTIHLLDQEPWENADFLAGSRVPEGRAKQWLATNTLILADEPHPGTGQRRSYRLLDIYQGRLVTVAGERLRIGPKEAMEIVNESLYGSALHANSSLELEDLRKLFRYAD